MTLETGTSAPEIIKTKLEGVTLRELSPNNLPVLKALLEKNKDFFAKGGVNFDYNEDSLNQTLEGGPDGRSYIVAIRNEDDLIGYVAVNGLEYPKVEISYGIDEAHAQKGITSEAVDIITDKENAKGHDVVAEVEHGNEASMRLLGRLGFEHIRYDDEEGREIYERIGNEASFMNKFM